ncbi:MAG: hypothetical protein ACREB3_13370, partial [Burkholderiales bacterium]
MGDPQEIRAIVERVVSEALESHVSELRREVVERVIREIEPVLESASAGESSAPGGAPTDVLNSVIASIQDVNSQSDILR